MAFIGSLVTTVKADTKPFRKNMKNSESTVEKFGKTLKSVGRGVVKFGKVLGTVAVIAAASGLAMIKLASDFEEADQKFGVVFQGVSDKASIMRTNLVRDFGLSTTAATELLSATGDLLTGFGFTDDAALSLSNKVQELSVDLASFNNLQGGAARASDIVTKALLGERDSLVSLGVKISEADLQQRLLINGHKELTGVALRAAKAEATFQLILEQTTKAQGDFGRSSQSLANLTKTATARLDDLATKFGTKLLPVTTVVVKEFLNLETSMLGWLAANDKLIDSEINKFLRETLLLLGQTADVLNVVRTGWNFLSIGVKKTAATMASLAGDMESVEKLNKSMIIDLGEMEAAWKKATTAFGQDAALKVITKLSSAIEDTKKKTAELAEQQEKKPTIADALKEELKLRAEVIKKTEEQAKEREKVIDEAKKIFEATRTPLENVEAEIKRIIELMTKGLEESLAEGLDRKLKELKELREKAIKEEAETVAKKAGIAAVDPTAKVGGFKELDLKNIDISGIDRALNIDKQQLSESKKQTDILQEILEINGLFPNVGVGAVAL